MIQKEYGSKLPDWTGEIFPKPLEDFAIANYLTQMMTPKMRSIAIGKLFNMLTDRMCL